MTESPRQTGRSAAAESGVFLFGTDPARAPSAAHVTAIRPAQKRPDRCVVEVSGRRVGELTLNGVDALDLRVGDAWTPALAVRFAEEVEFETAKDQAMRDLARRDRSHADIVLRLVRRGHTSAMARRVADHLAERSLLDDVATAGEIIRSTLSQGPAGRSLLERRLAKGLIEADVARSAVDEAMRGQDQAAAALELARRHASRFPSNLDARAAARRLFGLLARRGFDEDSTRSAVRAALLERGVDAGALEGL